MSDWQSYLDAQAQRFTDELAEFLTIPSISSLPDHAADVARAAAWVAGRCRAAGLEEVEVVATAGHPAVVGQWLGAADGPTLLIYGHFDTQPVDPLDEWTTPPFEPRLADDRIYARGASDDKGNMLAPLLAIESLMQTAGRLPVNVKVLFEGEEEIGSRHLRQLLEQHVQRLACDVVFSADGSGLGDPEAPDLVTGFRGLCAFEIAVEGPCRDLHSGLYGGAVQNPLHALSTLVASLHDGDGRVAVDGFYESVAEPTDQQRRQSAALPHDDGKLCESLGISALVGEPSYSPLERMTLRPTLEINGMWGGFQDVGVKTVIPRIAHAKISCRLVPDQEPEQVYEVVESHLQRHLPAGARLTLSGMERARPYLLPQDHPALAAAREVVELVCGPAPLLSRSGGTLPVCDLILQTLGTYTVTFAAGLADEQAHSPDEFFRLSSFRRAQRAYASLFEHLAGVELKHVT